MPERENGQRVKSFEFHACEKAKMICLKNSEKAAYLCHPMAFKGKIVNDPIYGFIRLQHPLVMQVISHPWYQRLRR
jgi:hypothetical protein